MANHKLLVNKTYVEIGGVKWATMNIGANSETDYGLYFQWGDTAGYKSWQCGSSSTSYKKPFNWNDYKFGNGTTSDSESAFTKYNGNDNKTTLDEWNDAAVANWGGKWRMPTTDEFIALGNATIFIDSGGTEITGSDKRTTLSGVTGIYLQDKTDTNKKLFFPVAGYGGNGSMNLVGSDGYYWSSSLHTSNKAGAYFLHFYSLNVVWQNYGTRRSGFSVRPVLDS